MARPQLRHLGIHVRDLAAMEAFYTKVLDLVATDRGAGQTFKNDFVFLTGSPDQHHQLVLVSGRAGDGPSTLNQISFRVATLDELKAMNGRVRQAGVAPIRPVNHGNALSIYFPGSRGQLCRGLSRHAMACAAAAWRPARPRAAERGDPGGDRGALPRRSRLHAAARPRGGARASAPARRLSRSRDKAQCPIVRARRARGRATPPPRLIAAAGSVAPRPLRCAAEPERSQPAPPGRRPRDRIPSVPAHATPAHPSAPTRQRSQHGRAGRRRPARQRLDRRGSMAGMPSRRRSPTRRAASAASSRCPSLRAEARGAARRGRRPICRRRRKASTAARSRLLLPAGAVHQGVALAADPLPRRELAEIARRPARRAARRTSSCCSTR